MVPSQVSRRRFRVRVRFFAQLRDITKCAETDVPYEETAGALARSLCTIYGNKLRGKIFPEEPDGKNTGGTSPGESFGPEIIVLINGRHVSHLGGTGAPLNPDDKVDIFPVVAGG
jgi:molybdopterin synthase sulfur carrier subunit